MSNFLVGPDTIIPDIKRLLEESYVIKEGGRDILPIIKEILQNANDAGATELEVRFYRQGFARSEVGNELLAAPAIVCLNNGRFRSADAYALGSMSVTSKTSDSTAIGRFGLGKKAVFHLAEVFFALGRAHGGNAHPLCINPWTNPATGRDIFEREWDAFEQEDQERIMALVDERWLQAQNWFALWLPIRVDRAGATIRRWFPDVTRLTERFFDDPAGVAALLPQLSSVQRVRITFAPSPGAPAERELEMRRVEGDALTLPSPPSEGALRRVLISWRTAGTERELVATIKDFREPSDALVQRLQANPHWPSRLTQKGTDYAPEPEKAVCHGGVTILREPSSNDGRDSTWAWAVFLPLAENKLQVAGPWRWRIWLHGYFFPDSGRQGPLGIERPLPASEDALADDTIRVYWNAHVRDRATLPCLLPALKDALEGVDTPHAEAFVQAICGIAELGPHAEALGRDFVLVFGPEGDATTACRLVPAERRIVALLRPKPTEWQAARLLLSALQRITTDTEIVWWEAPRLGARVKGGLGKEEWMHLVSSDEVARSFMERAAIEYVARCIETLAEKERAEVARAMLRKGLSQQSKRQIEPEAWRCVVAYLPGKCLFLPPLTRDEMLELLALETGVLVLPPDFEVGGRRSPELIPSDVASLLEWAGRRLEERKETARRLIREVVTAYGISRALNDPQLAKLPVIPVRSAREPGVHYIGFAAFDAALRQRCLFVGREVFRSEVPGELLRALGRHVQDVLVVEEPDWIAVLQAQRRDVLALSLAAVIDLVAAPQTRLSANREDRLPLLKWILEQPPAKGEQDTGKSQRAVKTLLYGEAGLQTRSPLCVPPNLDRDVQELLLTTLAGLGWAMRIIPPGITVRHEWLRALDIDYVDSGKLITLLQGFDDSGYAEMLAALSADQKRQLRKLLAAHKEQQVWRRLEIHPTHLGLRSLREAVFRRSRNGDWPVPETLQDEVAILDEADPDCAEWARATIPEWSPAAQLDYCLHAPRPSRHWREISNALAFGGAGTLDAQRQDTLKTPWMPEQKGGALPPVSVILVPPSVDQALWALDGLRLDGVITETGLPSEVSAHPGFAVVRRWITQGEEPWAVRLVLALRRGGLPLLIPSALPGATTLDGLLNARSLEVYPELRLFRAVRDSSPGEWADLRGECAHLVSGNLPGERFVELLTALSKEPEDRDLWRDYLRAAAGDAAFASAILSRLQLPNREGAFVAPEMLARSAASIAPRHLLARTAEEALAEAGWFKGDEDAHAGLEPAAGEEVSGSKHFERWITGWKAAVREQKLLSALLVLLGDQPPLKAWEWAERLDMSTPRFVLEQLLGSGSELTAKWMQEVKYSVDFVSPGSRVKVLSLTGAWFDAEIVAQSREDLTIFVGHLPKLREAHTKQQQLTLAFAPESLGAEEADAAVRRSIELFLDKVADRRGRASAYLGRLLARPGEERIRIFRAKIAGELPSLLQNLRRGAPRPLYDALNNLDTADLEQQEAQVQLDTLPDTAQERERSQRRKQLEERKLAVETARGAVEALVFQDGPDAQEVQTYLLKVLRHRVSEYQYQPEQVLFELAQNADDALAQLSGPVPGPPLQLRFDDAERRIVLIHRGRAINDTLGLQRSDPCYGPYSRDLLNLLKLNVSDKDPATNTGHFGIGFKSVYLLTDDPPEVVSGSLAFRIRACLAPERWDPPADLRAEGDRGGTAFRLRVRDEELYRRAAAQFRRYGGLLCVFSRAVRELSWREQSGESQARWKPGGLEPGWLEVGDLQVSFERGEATRRVLVMRSPRDERLAVALALSGRGVERFAGNLPTLWCTAPTRVCWDVGILINAPFEVDVGRTNLANGNPANDRLFRLVGDCVQEGLSRLWKRGTSDWGALAAELGVPRDREDGSYALWESVFELFSHPRLAANAQAREVLRGYMRFLREEGVAALPSRLSGVWRRCLAPQDVRWALTAELDEVSAGPGHSTSRSLWETFSRWSWIRARFAPGTVVSCRVGEVLSAHGDQPAPGKLGFPELLDGARVGGVVGPEQSAELDVLRVLSDQGVLPPSLVEEHKQWAKSARFLTEDGGNRPAAELLLNPTGETRATFEGSSVWSDVEDELLRAAFAPASARLSSRYETAALRYFRFARHRLDADSRQLAKWAQAASTLEERRAVLAYLLRGHLRTELTKILLAEGLRWCQKARDLEAVTRGTDLSQTQLAALLFEADVTASITAQLQQAAFPFPGVDVYDEDVEEQEPPPPAEPPRFASRDFAQAIADWWRGHGGEYVAKYEEQLYPSEWDRQVFKESLAEEAATPRSRDAWLTLLTLGACHRFGRQNRAQHRGFLEKLRSGGGGSWWKTISREQSSSEAWMRILDEWMAGQVAHEMYSLWLGLFPALYCFSTFLPTYAQLLLNVDRAAGSGQFDMQLHLRPRANPALSGSGLDAPPIAVALGQGASFVLRELARLGLIEPRGDLQELCYVPYRSTRALVEHLSGSAVPMADDWRERSRVIARWSRDNLAGGDPTFARCYDLPILTLYERAGTDASVIARMVGLER